MVIEEFPSRSNVGKDEQMAAVPLTRDHRRQGPTDQKMVWSQQAACRGRTSLFFPPRAERPQARVRREAQARQLCEACGVQGSCKEYARMNREYGYWGSESEEERHLAGYTVAAPIGVRARSSHPLSA